MGATIIEAGTTAANPAAKLVNQRLRKSGANPLFMAVITKDLTSDTPPVNIEQLAPLFPIGLGVGIPQFWEEVAQEQQEPAEAQKQQNPPDGLQLRQIDDGEEGGDPH